MKQISQEEIKPVREFFNSLWAFLKENYHPETEADWKQMLDKARSLPTGDGLLNKLGVGMVTCVMEYIAEINQEKDR